MDDNESNHEVSRDLSDLEKGAKPSAEVTCTRAS